MQNGSPDSPRSGPVPRPGLSFGRPLTLPEQPGLMDLHQGLSERYALGRTLGQGGMHGRSVRLTDDRSLDTNPFPSPDDCWVLFDRAAPMGGDLWTMEGLE